MPERNETLEQAKSEDNATTTLLNAFDKFVANVTKPASEAALPVLAQSALRDFIHDTDISHLLWVKPISSGGEAITKKQLFRSGHVSYIGGGVISYVLADKDGIIVSADTTQGLFQVTHVLSANRNYRLKHVALGPAKKNIVEQFFEWLNF